MTSKYVFLYWSDLNSNTGEAIKIYRENFGLTQEGLGKKLGGYSRQNISAMENGRRGISKNVVKKLSKVFKVPTDRFI